MSSLSKGDCLEGFIHRTLDEVCLSPDWERCGERGGVRLERRAKDDRGECLGQISKYMERRPLKWVVVGNGKEWKK